MAVAVLIPKTYTVEHLYIPNDLTVLTTFTIYTAMILSTLTFVGLS